MAARFLRALIIAIAMLVVPAPAAHAGGPRTIAGTSYFDPVVKGTPADLEPGRGQLLHRSRKPQPGPTLRRPPTPSWPTPSVDGLRFRPRQSPRRGPVNWPKMSAAPTSAPSGGTIALPADIRPSANNFPVAIVYDADGAVTNALLGQGAGSAAPASPTPPTAAWTASAQTLICCTRW